LKRDRVDEIYIELSLNLKESIKEIDYLLQNEKLDRVEKADSVSWYLKGIDRDLELFEKLQKVVIEIVKNIKNIYNYRYIETTDSLNEIVDIGRLSEESIKIEPKIVFIGV